MTDNLERVRASMEPDQQAEWVSPNAQRAGLRRSLELEVSDLRQKLAPIDANSAIVELTKCLILAAPSGMAEDERNAWIKVAFEAISNVPAAHFADACANARRTADHPAKIVPAILGYKPDGYDPLPGYRRRLANAEQRLRNLDAPRLTSAPAMRSASEIEAANRDARRAIDAIQDPELRKTLAAMADGLAAKEGV